MEPLACYAYWSESRFTLDVDGTRETRPTHTVVVVGNAKTDDNGLCRLPLYDFSQMLPRFCPPTGWPQTYIALPFSKILNLVATPAKLLTPPPAPGTFESLFGGIMLTSKVEISGPGISLEANEEAVSQALGGDGPIVYSDEIPVCYCPTLIFKSWTHDGRRCPQVEFSWRLEGEMIRLWKQMAFRKAPVQEPATMKP